MFLLSGSALISWSVPSDLITSFGTMTVVSAEDPLMVIQKMLVSIHVAVRRIPLTYIVEW
jgi:hypothetical protein